MDEDLKIVLAAELEADEKASAQRIAAQLPSISKMVNAGSRIKIGVELDASETRAQAQRVNQQITQAMSSHAVGVTLSLDAQSVNKIQNELSNLEVNPDIARAMTDQLDSMGIQIDKITGHWEKVADEQERMLSLTIQGTDQMQRTVSLLQTYDKQTGEINTTLTSVTENLKQQRQEQERLTNQQRAAADSNQAYIQKWGAAIREIIESYGNMDLGQEQMDALNKKMVETVSTMNGMTAEGEKFSQSQITSVDLAIKAYRNLANETVAAARQQQAAEENRLTYINKTQIALDKLIASYKGESSSKPLVDAGHLAEVGSKVEEVTGLLEGLRRTTGAVGTEQQNQVAKALADLDGLIAKYRNLEYVATTLRTKTAVDINAEQVEKLAEYENSLKSAGILTKEFQDRIGALRESLKTAFDRESLTAYLNGFDQLKSSVSNFQQQVKSLDGIFTKIIAVEQQIASVEASMTNLNPDTRQGKLLALQGELAILNQQKASLEAQLAPYSDIIQYSSQAKALEESRLINGAKLVESHMELADKAREYDAAMRLVPSTISDLQTKFSQIVSPTETLKENMRELRETAARYSADMSDREKVQTYERLSVLIGECRKEMSELIRVQNGDFNNVKFTEGLEKAKADLAVIARTWSAFKRDPGLLDQFRQLEAGLRNVNNQMDLKKWTAQFSTFKAEVKAAGKNMLSLGDVLKNNLGKVLQWVSATTLLFRAFRLLKQAISTVTELDTAMIDLQKVTTATAAEYQKFYINANDTAKALGVTTQEVISQTAEWARLGYALNDAAELAKNSAIFEAISPDMDITQATDGLVSIIKAFDVEVEDTMDSIISKVNEVGNKFAVSNGDIVEALTRSSSAMAAANNTFEETVALATAAIEITRDAATVGNGLKTLSMRIRGYDEETEELTGDVKELTGTIADLTKTAEKPGGISLFKEGEPDTYRSTYEILSDIAEIWDDLTDKNRANLLEALFGKRQAQIGSAILSNFDQARDAIEKMENSAGSAAREMEKIEQSLEYRLNALRETWVGVAQNLFQTDDLKYVVDGLTAFSEAIASLTEHLGLFGSVGLVATIAGLNNLRKTMVEMNSVVTPVVQQLNTMSFDGSARSVLEYASALSSLDPIQRNLAMNLAGLNAQQQEQIVNMIAAMTAARELTVAELEQQLGMEAGTIANSLNVTSTSQVTEALLRAAVANGVLNEAQLTQILGTTAQTAANVAGAASFETLGATARAAGAAMMATPIGWISLLIGLLPLAITGISKLYDWLVVTAEEAYEEAEKFKSSYEEINKEVESLSDELKKNQDRLSELRRMSDNGTITLVEQEELARLQQTNAELEITIARKRELAEIDAKKANEGYVDSFNKTTFQSNRSEILLTEMNGIYEQYSDLLNKFDQSLSGMVVEWEDGELEKATELRNRIAEIQQMFNSGFDTDNGTWLNQDIDFASHVQELVDAYGEFNRMQEDGITLSEAQRGAFDSIRQELLNLSQTLDEDYLAKYVGEDQNTEEWNRLLDLINKTVFAVEYFNQKLSELPSACTSALEELGENASLTAEGVAELAEKFPELAAWMEESGYTAEDVAKHFNALADSQDQSGASAVTYTAQLSDLSEALSSLQDSYSALAKAEEDMATGKGLSPETITALAKAEEDYLKYLYEENGVVKLNTEAWKENAQAKMLSDMSEIQKEIDSLNERNAVLQESIEYYKQQREIGYDGGIWTKQIEEATSELKENTKAIEENQGKLAVFKAMFGNVTGEMDAYTAALKNFSNVSSNIDTMTSSFKSLADLQAEVANGFTMSLEKAMEFAKVYPQILNNAEVAANGQITLNEDVVNSFIEGKQAELDAEIDAEIAKLESEKAALEAKMESAKAQLELAKSVGEGEGQISKETAEYRINVGNAMTDALIQMGVDEADAYALATAAMSEDEEEFARVAKECFQNMDDNAAKAAYNMAHAVFVNADKSCNSIADIAKQAHETAKAIAAMGDGEVAGSTGNQFRGSDGTKTGGLSLDLYNGDFKGTDYDYDAHTIGLDDYIAQIELDISAYENAIAQIDGQIATLEALRNLPLESFQSGSKSGGSGKGGSGSKGGSGGSGGSGSGSDSKIKEVEEYIATIDQYRDAVERLRRAQAEAEGLEGRVEDATSYEQRISLQRELIDAYRKEQEALHDLNDLRDTTITGSVEALRALGFEVQYNADTNELWISNLEHLNELTAENQGEYETMQEATNALRKETEDLIGTITDLNKENQEGSATWKELQKNIRDTITAMYEGDVKLRQNQITLTENWYNSAVSRGDMSAAKEYRDTIISYYREIQQVKHDEAEALRAAGYSDTSDEVSKLSDEWWGLEDSIRSTTEAYYDAVRAMHENNISLAENLFDDAVNRKSSEEVKRYADSIIESYRAIQAVYKEEEEALRSSTNPDLKRLAELSNAWWDLEDKIQGAKDKLVSYYTDIADAASSALDDIQKASDTLHKMAQEYADNGGWISIDSFQAVRDMGVQYLQMLMDENGQLVINEERINAVIAARTRQLAVEQAMAYVEQIKLAAMNGETATLNALCFATNEATNATWGLVYAEMALLQQMGLLTNAQYDAAMHNIQAIQSLAETAVAGIGQVAGEAAAAEKEAQKAAEEAAKAAREAEKAALEAAKKDLEDTKKGLEDLKNELKDMKDGCDDLVKYVMDMLKHKIQQQVDALNEAKKAVKEYVDKLKEMARAQKEETEYGDKVADKLKAIAKLQARIDALSLDDSRKAQAEKMALEEELAGLQKDLADYQAEHATKVTEDALDKQYEAYEQEKDDEIDKLKETISSTQKLYDMAIAYIRDHWDTLYGELIDWNTEYGSSLNTEITKAWEAAQNAASRYGDFVTAVMGGIENEISNITGQIDALTAQISAASSQISSLGSGSGSSGSGSSSSGGSSSGTTPKPTVVSPSGGDTSYSEADMRTVKENDVRRIVSKMKANGAAWHTADDATKQKLASDTLTLGASLAAYGISAERDGNGVWWIRADSLNPGNVGKELYKVYHTGGFVGQPPLKQDEQYIKAENGELVLTRKQQDTLAEQIDRLSAIGEAMGNALMDTPITPQSLWSDNMAGDAAGAVNTVTNNNQPTIKIEETITCVPEQSVSAHVKLNRDLMNQISRQIRGM